MKALDEYNSTFSPPPKVATKGKSSSISSKPGPVTSTVLDSLFPRHSERRHRIVTQTSPTASPVKNPASHTLNQLKTLEVEQKKLTESINNNNSKLNKKNQLDLLFLPYDINRNGEVTYKDFTSTLIKSGINLSKSEIFMLIKDLDKSNKGLINYKNLKYDLENLKQQNDKKLGEQKSDSASSAATSSSLSLHMPPVPPESEPETEGYYNAYLRTKNSPTVSSNNSPVFLSSPVVTTKIRSLSPNHSFKVKNVLEDNSNKFTHEIKENHHENSYVVEKENEKKISYTDAHRSTMAPYLVFSDSNSNLEINSKFLRTPSAPPRISSSTSSLNNFLRSSGPNSTESTPKQRKKVALTQPNLRSELESRSKRANSASAVSSTSILETHPYFKKQIEAKENKLSQQRDEVKMIDTTVLSQLKSKFPLFRHHLNTLDRSKSGLVNFNELKKIFKRLDVNLSDKQAKIFFDKHALSLNEVKDSKNSKYHTNLDTREIPIGTMTNNKGIFINSLIESLESKLISSTFQHNFQDIHVPQTNENLSTYIKNNKEIKLFKNILHNFNKNHNIDHLLSHVAPEATQSSGRWVTPKQLREVIERSGTNISDLEFDYVMEKLDKKVLNQNNRENSTKNKDVMVSLNSIDEVINRAIQIGTYENSRTSNQNLTSNPRYSNTYRSQISLGSDLLENQHKENQTSPKQNNSNNFKMLLQSNNSNDLGGFCNPFSPISNTRKVRQERQHWEKLRDLLQNHYSQALESFIENKNDKNAEDKLKASLIEPHLHKTSFSNQYNNKLHSKSLNYNTEVANSNSIPFNHLQEKFSKAGILLGNEDIKFIQNEIIYNRNNSVQNENENESNERGRERTRNSNNEVKFDEFCRAFDLNQNKNTESSFGGNGKINNSVSFVNFNKNNVQFNAQSLLNDPIYNKKSDSNDSLYKNSLNNTVSSKINDYLKVTNESNQNKLNFLVESNGIFTSSRNSIHGNPSYSLSAFFNNEDNQRIRTFNTSNKDTVTKFWEFQKSNENPMAFAYPLKSFRDPLPPKNQNQKQRSKSADPRLRSFYSSSSAPNSPLSVRTTSLSQYYFNQMNTSDSMSSNNRYSTETLVPNYSTTPKVRLNNVRGSSTLTNFLKDNSSDDNRNDSSKNYSQYNKANSRSSSAPPSLRRQHLHEKTSSTSENSPTTSLKNNVSKWTGSSTLSDYMHNKSTPSTPVAGRPTSRRPTTPNLHGSYNAPFATDY